MKNAQRNPRTASGDNSLQLAEYPLFYMAHIVAESQRKIQEAIRPLKISPNEWRVIFLLHEHGPMSISDISEQGLIEISTLSRLLKPLEARGLLDRQRDEEDQRYRKVQLTDDGQGVFAQIIPVVTRQLEFTQQGLSREDRRTLLRMLRQMKDDAYRSPFAVA
jgi:DNA-binding MarR family transcriptional regulator